MQLDCTDSSVSFANWKSIYEQHRFLLHWRVSFLGVHFERAVGRNRQEVGGERLNYYQFSQIQETSKGSCSLQTDTLVFYWFCSFQKSCDMVTKCTTGREHPLIKEISFFSPKSSLKIISKVVSHIFSSCPVPCWKPPSYLKSCMSIVNGISWCKGKKQNKQTNKKEAAQIQRADLYSKGRCCHSTQTHPGAKTSSSVTVAIRFQRPQQHG